MSRLLKDIEVVHASDYFIYTTPSTGQVGVHATTVVFINSDAVRASDIANSLASYFERVAYPERIWILGTHDRVDAISRLAGSSDILDRIPSMTRYMESPTVLPAYVRTDGSIFTLDQGGDEQVVDADIQRRVFQTGLSSIFLSHNGMLSSSGGYHYEKPSKRHSAHFLRTGNVLLFGSEIAFIAAAMLGRIRGKNIRRIYTDSSSINSLGYALADTLTRLSPECQRPSVESFQGYQGVKLSHPVESDEHSLVLISASTSGGLVEEVHETYGVPPSQQIIIYYVGSPAGASHSLCDLTRRENGRKGFLEPIESWASSGCELCLTGQPTVSLAGDQFLPANPTINPKMLRATDAPPWLSDFMESVFGQNVISFNGPSRNDEPGAQYVALELGGIINGAEDSSVALSIALRRNLERYIPAGTKWIIHLDDEDSVRLAWEVRKLLADFGVTVSPDQIVSASSITDTASGSEKPVLGAGLALVIAAGASSGRRLLSVSRALRAIHVSSPIAYFILLAHPSRETEWLRLESNLSFGEGNPKLHDVRVVQKILIPAEHEVDFTWSKERRQLRIIADRLLSNGEPGPKLDKALAAVERRILELNQAPAGGGLIDNVFLPGFASYDSASIALSLQPNFAFWKFKFEEHERYLRDGVNPTQAEVFFTMLSVLHAMRNASGSSAPVLSNDHHWSVIAPGNFGRFNDPVIQASLLRAASARELDYSSSASLSHEMTDLVSGILGQWASTHGHASAEFLLALASNRLRLCEGDRLRIIRECESILPEFPPLLRAIADFLILADSLV